MQEILILSYLPFCPRFLTPPGQVISALRETGLLNNTVVIFTADHGEMAMEHRQFYKMSMFEGSSHVPLMIMGPGLMSGLQVNQLVSLVDLYPTVLGKEVDRKIGLKCLNCLPTICKSKRIKALIIFRF